MAGSGRVGDLVGGRELHSDPSAVPSQRADLRRWRCAVLRPACQVQSRISTIFRCSPAPLLVLGVIMLIAVPRRRKRGRPQV